MRCCCSCEAFLRHGREEGGWSGGRTAIFSAVAHINACRRRFYWRAAAEEMVESRRLDHFGGVFAASEKADMKHLPPTHPVTDIWQMWRSRDSKQQRSFGRFVHRQRTELPLHIFPLKRPPVIRRNSNCPPHWMTDCCCKKQEAVETWE